MSYVTDAVDRLRSHANGGPPVDADTARIVVERLDYWQATIDEIGPICEAFRGLLEDLDGCGYANSRAVRDAVDRARSTFPKKG